jgi:hypothetical protein
MKKQTTDLRDEIHDEPVPTVRGAAGVETGDVLAQPEKSEVRANRGTI